MSAFQQRSLNRSKTLGERLRRVREEAGVTLERAAAETRIQERYLRSLEEGDYATLPGPVYIESFLRAYATYLNVSVDYVLTLYRTNEQRVTPKLTAQEQLQPKNKLPRSVVTPQRLRFGLLALVVLAGLGYIVTVVTNIFSPPELTVWRPSDGLTVTEPAISIQGVTEPESRLTINGKEILLDSEGRFDQDVTLQEGVNTITVASQKKHGNPTVVTRTILFEQPSPSS